MELNAASRLLATGSSEKPIKELFKAFQTNGFKIGKEQTRGEFPINGPKATKALMQKVAKEAGWKPWVHDGKAQFPNWEGTYYFQTVPNKNSSPRFAFYDVGCETLEVVKEGSWL